MKSLLIVGAGGHGQVVKKIAQDLGYERIDFIDDHNSHAIGKIKDFEKIESGNVKRGFKQALVKDNSNDEFVREEKEKTGMDISFF